MQAAVVRDFRQGPRCESFELPAGAEGVRLRVLAAALSPRARSAASGEHYTSEGVLPLIPGVDGVGLLPEGHRVYFLAANDALGTMAQESLAHPRLMVPLPAAVDSAAVAAGMLPAISSWIALTKRAPLLPGQRVLVLGATGTAGLLAVQIAKHLGAGEVIAAGRDPASLERARALGADRTVRISGRPEDAEAIAQAASEVDLVLDYLWGEVTTALLPTICHRRGDESRALHWVLIGSMAGQDIALSSVLLRKRNLHLLGSGQGASSTAELFGAAPDVVKAFASGALTVQVRAAPLAEIDRLWTARLRSGERLVFVP